MAPNPEKRKSVAQVRRRRKAAMLKRVHELRGLLARQGSVISTWRRCRGQRSGPYYRLVFRADGRQHSIYLGRSGRLAARVRAIVEQYRQPLSERRQLARLRKDARAAFRAHKVDWARELAKVGVRLKGNDLRGVRKLKLPNRARVLAAE